VQDFRESTTNPLSEEFEKSETEKKKEGRGSEGQRTQNEKGSPEVTKKSSIINKEKEKESVKSFFKSIVYLIKCVLGKANMVVKSF
jgi:hypothetical protein